jgi:hypothetical protein
MGLVLRMLKNLFFWHYSRSTWQYDVLCVLILAFIFLTPQRWFDNGELRSGETHQNVPMAKQVILQAETLSPNPGANEIEQRIQVLTNDFRAQVKEVRPIQDTAGKIVAYEVDIR